MTHCIVLNIVSYDDDGNDKQPTRIVEIVTGGNKMAVEHAATDLQRQHERMGATVTRGIR